MDIDFTKGKLTNPISKEKVENIQKRTKLWVELREKYSNDEEIKNLSIEDMIDNNFWFEKYGEKLK